MSQAWVSARTPFAPLAPSPGTPTPVSPSVQASASTPFAPDASATAAPSEVAAQPAAAAASTSAASPSADFLTPFHPIDPAAPPPCSTATSTPAVADAADLSPASASAPTPEPPPATPYPGATFHQESSSTLPQARTRHADHLVPSASQAPQDDFHVHARSLARLSTSQPLSASQRIPRSMPSSTSGFDAPNLPATPANDPFNQPSSTTTAGSLTPDHHERANNGPDFQAPSTPLLQQHFHNLSVAANGPLPSSLPAAYFPALGSPDDEHVTVWHPATGKTVAGNAAPYRRNLMSWLASHEGWEEKADELKSYKRRSAARRIRSAASAFAALCAFPVATALVAHADASLQNMSREAPNADLSTVITTGDWSNDDYVRLQEALYQAAQKVHAAGSSFQAVPSDMWTTVNTAVGHGKELPAVMYVSRHMLHRGIQKHVDAAVHPMMSTAGSPTLSGNGAGEPGTNPFASNPADSEYQSSSHPLASIPIPEGIHSSGQVNFENSPHHSNAQLPSSFSAVPPPIGPSRGELSSTPHLSSPAGNGHVPANGFDSMSLPNMDSATHFLDRSFRCPREPRITVWKPTTGRTVSGNAAPCRKNLDTWLQQHPGWVVKGEEQLSSSRRARRTPPTAIPPRSGTQTYADQALVGSAPTTAFNGVTHDGSALSVAPLPPESPAFAAAIEGLLAIGQSEQRHSSAFTSSVSSGSSGDDEGVHEDEDGRDDDEDDENVVGDVDYVMGEGDVEMEDVMDA